MKRTILLPFLILGFCYQGIGQLLMQDFSSSILVSDYYNSSAPNNGQFNAIGTTGAGVTVSVLLGTLDFTRALNNTGSFSRTTDFSPTPTTLQYKVNMSVSGNLSAQTTAAVFQVGSGFGTANSAESNANVYARFAINLSSTPGTFQIRDITNGTNSTDLSGTQSITWLLNNSGVSLTYLAPDNSYETIADDRTDIWAGSVKLFDDVLIQTTTQSMTDLKFVFSAGSATISLDDFEINPIPVIWLNTGTTDWNTASNWGLGNVPTSSDNIIIPSGGNQPIINQDVLSPALCNNLTINSSVVLTIAAAKALTVSGTLTNSAGTGGLVIEDGGSFITNGAVSGSATIKKVIDADAKRHFISSPVSGQNICDDVFAPLEANFNSTTGATYDCYKWSVTAGSLNWLNLKNTDWSLNTIDFGLVPQFGVGEGYLVAYGATFGGSSTKTFTGTLLSGDQSITLGSTGNQWNLIGNPFASAINWDVVSKTNLVDGYYNVYNENKAGGAGYEYYLDASHKSSGANGNISIAQGFFVKASGADITIPNSARVHDNNWMKKLTAESQNQLKLTLGNNSNYDETFIQFESQGANGRDFFDAEKMFSMDSEIPQLYSVIDNDILLAFNSMPYNSESFGVPVGLYIPVEGEYWFKIEGLENFVTAPEIRLEDNKTGLMQDLNDGQIYSFNAFANDDPNRFVLRFGPVGLTENTPDNNRLEVYTYDNQLYIMNVTDDYQAEVIDIQGHIMQVFRIVSNGTFHRNLDLPAGAYIIRLQNSSSVKSIKVIIY
ncbi:MAG: T9SS type A sorting domain-containing protein [Bacteroidales bacterium]|nr:T9SS type A sorting domain-containing protein [Bacteroidales bacterium]